MSTCSTGKNTTPHPHRCYDLLRLQRRLVHPTYYVKPVRCNMNLERAIAMHSSCSTQAVRFRIGTQGTLVSHGCVRMPPGRGELDCGPCAHWHHGGGIFRENKKHLSELGRCFFFFRLQPQQVFQISWLIFLLSQLVVQTEPASSACKSCS